MKLLPGGEEKKRRNFLYGLIGAFSALVLGRFFTTGQKIVKATEKKDKPVKMLTQDGRLVEVDPSFLTGARRQIKADEIHNWVKRKTD